MEYSTLGAVDLGSNSFHLAVGRVVDDQIYPLDSLKEAVRLGAGLTRENDLDERTQLRALETLRRFAERLAGMPRESVRVVGTNTLRVARNAAPFLREAERALGFPIEVISGREEARLIYLGVAHSLPMAAHNRLVIDVGGGSTELIIGRKLRPRIMASLYMGCVSYSERFFPGGRVDKKAMKAAESAARVEVQAIASRFERTGWKEAVGSSGTVRSIAEVLAQNARAERGITPEGLAWLREALIEAGDVSKVSLAGLRDDRLPVIAGGLAVLSAAFAELDIDRMTVADGALRQGLLWDLLGRTHHRDIREVTVEQFARRYHVDQAQARRVAKLAGALLLDLDPDKRGELSTLGPFLAWAAMLHEVGISIAQGAYHKHSAYILANADMPGFSRQAQARLSNLVLAQRGNLAKLREAFADDPRLVPLAFCLRAAVIFHRSRRVMRLPWMKAERAGKGLRIEVAADWLAEHNLVALALDAEREQWDSVGVSFEFVER